MPDQTPFDLRSYVAPIAIVAIRPVGSALCGGVNRSPVLSSPIHLGYLF